MRSNTTIKYTKASMMGLFYEASVLQFDKNISCLQIVGRYISVFTTGLQDMSPMRVQIPLPR